MKLSVAYTFDPGLMAKLSKYPEVYEVFGKLTRDIIGGGRSSYTLRKINESAIRNTVHEAHKYNIQFNYLLNGATLNGIEQTRKGQRKLRNLLEFLLLSDVDSITVASPYLLRLIKKQYPKFKVRASAFAMVATPDKARQWEDMGADTICISAIATNRNFKNLEKMKRSVSCELQLIANASCLTDCSHEITHMNMLTNSSRTNDRNKGFCLDYCFLNCSKKRLEDPVNFIKSVWIRPEDIHIYEDLGFSNFKILERSCPTELLIRRVDAYVKREFSGNLLELVAPVAHIKKEQDASLSQRLRVIFSMFKPSKAKISTLLATKEYMEQVILHDFDKLTTPIYIDNKKLDGFLKEIMKRDCKNSLCSECLYCNSIASNQVVYNEDYRVKILKLARELDKGLISSSHWLRRASTSSA
jgi:collagenase-like PrtC family protease